MLLYKPVIDRNSFVNDIVKQHHHTADIFRKYGIEYCCGGKWPLETVCLSKGIEFDQLRKELEKQKTESLSKEEKLTALQQQVDVLKIGAHGWKDSNKKELEKRIESYLKEVEKCLALLNA